jgi:hypothetical protein
MPMEIREADSPKSFDLYDGDEKIGKIAYVPPTVEFGVPNPECWEVVLWSLTGSAKEWGDTVYTIDDAITEANLAYPDQVAERRAANSAGSGPRPRIISTPMGGQRRRK